MTCNCLAVIPARGGSKRVPRKNIRPLAGKALIAYTVDAALGCNVFDRVVVSTDCPEIAAVAEAAGAEVPFLRESELADDLTPVSAATVAMLRRLDPASNEFSRVCQLMANCPLRTASDVVDSYRQFLDSGSRSQISVVQYGWQNPWWAMKRAPNFALTPLFGDALGARSQDLPELYCPTGAIWWARADALIEAGTFHVPDRTGWEIDWRHGLDIDTEEDWAMAEVLAASDLVVGSARKER